MQDKQVPLNQKEKTKVESLEIIVTGTREKPYYNIKYKEVGNDYYNIGYSSYNLDYVFDWKEQYFELVECDDIHDICTWNRWKRVFMTKNRMIMITEKHGLHTKMIISENRDGVNCSQMRK